jgi:predicted 3-demethylubiquinone-9 3-methyltransferase (glyoxalase superfamily)
MQTITPHLWFDKGAREAAELYVSLVPGSAIKNIRTIKGTPSGDCDFVSFELAGQPFLAISAGPLFRFNPSVSFHIKCGTTQEVDAVWERLLPGGKILMPIGSYPFSERFGWVEDKYGVSWAVIHIGDQQVRQRITPVLLLVGRLAGKAEEALHFYASVFAHASGAAEVSPTSVQVFWRHGAGAAPEVEGTVQYAEVSLGGTALGAVDSARDHSFSFNEAISFLIPCDTQEEIDYFWEKLSADPKAERCGWLKDKYGLSWQVAPAAMQKFLDGADPERTRRVTQAFLRMKKFNIAELERAAEG